MLQPVPPKPRKHIQLGSDTPLLYCSVKLWWNGWNARWRWEVCTCSFDAKSWPRKYVRVYRNKNEATLGRREGADAEEPATLRTYWTFQRLSVADAPPRAAACLFQRTIQTFFGVDLGPSPSSKAQRGKRFVGQYSIRGEGNHFGRVLTPVMLDKSTTIQ